MDIAAAILHCRPGALWSCGDTYASIVWLDQQQAKPTEAELAAAWQQLQAAAAARKVWRNAQAFAAEFTDAEVAGIALSSAPTVAAMRFRLTTWFGEIHSDNADVLAGLDALVAAAILTPERRTQILTPHAP